MRRTLAFGGRRRLEPDDSAKPGLTLSRNEYF
jgi:hypothetical protein